MAGSGARHGWVEAHDRQGSRCDLVIDAGLGIWNLPEFLTQSGLIGKKPVLAVATHCHFDHVGGLHQFKQVCRDASREATAALTWMLGSHP